MDFTIESGPSTAGRLLAQATRFTLRTALQVGCRAPLMSLPWPYGAVEAMCRAIPKAKGTKRTTIQLPHTTAQLVRASGVEHRTGRVILYLHGGAFLVCGPNTHSGMITRLSKYSDAPVLAVDYRMVPRNSVTDAVQDCLDAYDWLRRHYEAHEIVVAGDSAGGYLALTLAQYLLEMGEAPPAALTLISPLLQLDPVAKKSHPNIRCDAMFAPEAFDALITLVRKANGGVLYEPLENVVSGLPPILIHVSGSEVLIHDARLAAERLGSVVEVRVWPGQIHVFQIAAPLVPEAKRSLQMIGDFIQLATLEELVAG